ncbi:MAG: HrpE/YscL family type III secretion apparatus protein [Deltaproteobacteria bacterium]|jgi:type III secretion protein L|nr:HrpE/YscL family type III secretion apparatus protein [Deltaproteobacteria bacterium]
MASLFLLNGQAPTIAPGVKLIKAPEASAFLSALELSAKMEAMKIESAKRAEEAYETRRNEGYQEGLATGLDEYTMKIMDTVISSVEYLEKLESDLAKIVEEAVRKIIGDLPPDQVAAGLVRKALTTMRDDRRVLVKVSPQDEPAVRQALLGASGSTSFLDVRSDGRLQHGQCVLESDLGVVEASLETQLKNLSVALSTRVKTGV